MSVISEVFLGGASGFMQGLKDVVSIFKADPLELAKLQAAISKTEAELTIALSQAQAKVNEIEAASQDKFVSRWRPAIGWICGTALAYSFVIQPFLAFILISSGSPVTVDQLPVVSMSELSTILMGMLGLGAMRSFDKWSSKPDKSE